MQLGLATCHRDGVLLAFARASSANRIDHARVELVAIRAVHVRTLRRGPEGSGSVVLGVVEQQQHAAGRG